MLSALEKDFIIDGIKNNVRIDGRDCRSLREIGIDNGILPNANGSARVRQGNTDVIVGVKCELSTPEKSKPNSGKVEFYFDCSKNVYFDIEKDKSRQMAMEVMSFITKAFSNSIKTESLCIVPSKLCWILHVDVLLLECGGNIYDVTALAVKVAMIDTVIPLISFSEDGDDQIDVQVESTINKGVNLDINFFPTVVTTCKIGDSYVLDACMQEEECSIASVVIAFDSNGNVVAVKKLRNGGLAIDSLFDIIDEAYNTSRTLREGVDSWISLNISRCK